jgi:hypothetical protein
MPWYFYIAHFFAALFAANCIPHFVNGISGRMFVSPFGKPPGRGESSAVSNVLWGGGNMIVAFLLIWFFPTALFSDVVDALVVAVGFFGMATMLANTFSQRRVARGG